MKSITHHNALPSNNPVHLQVAGQTWQRVINNLLPEINTPELKMSIIHSAKQVAEKVNKPVTSKSKIYIKNMVSIRCKMVVKAILENLGLHYIMVELGSAEIMEELTEEMHNRLKSDLLNFGLELMDGNSSILIEKIKNIIVEMVHYSDELPSIKTSTYISQKLYHDYTYLGSLFSRVMGITIEHYMIKHKIERAKELITYDELGLKEIAYKLHYSSVAHLSTQFKQVTGLTITNFKKIKNERRTALENV